MKTSAKCALGVVLSAVAVMVFLLPAIMIAPGAVIADHHQIAQDCFACHTPLLGTSNERCIACHKPAEIGKVTTSGTPIVVKQGKPAFHQSLKENNCMACHTDHAGVMRLQTPHKFNHAMLAAEMQPRCTTCHTRPPDPFHQRVRGECSACHRDTASLPATFDHSRYFVFDREHNVACETCHRQGNYSQYICYGCHEHTRATIRREHFEEGIRNFEQCVRCHRSAEEEAGD